MEHYSYIKDVFLTLIINSGNFPYLNLQDFSKFINSLGLLDNTLTTSRIDVIVKTVKAKPKGLDMNKLPN